MAIVAQLSDMAAGLGFFGGEGGGWRRRRVGNKKTSPIRTNNRGFKFFIANTVFIFNTLKFCSLIYLCVNTHHVYFKELMNIKVELKRFY